MIGLPIVAVIALITIVGIPFGLGLLGALGLIHAIAYVVGALWLGRFMVKEPKSAIGAFFAGWAILRVIALIPGVGVLGWIVAVVIGGGAITIALFRSGRGPLEPPPERTVPPAGEVPPATDETTDAGATSWSADETTATDEPAPATARRPRRRPVTPVADHHRADARRARQGTGEEGHPRQDDEGDEGDEEDDLS